MANANPTGQGTAKCLTTFDEDERDQRAVLRQVLEHHPDSCTRDELTREMTSGGPTAFAEADQVERAIRDLAATGLLHRPSKDEMVRPTRAAVRYFELSGGF